MPETAIPAYITSLIRHFEDLRDGTHGGSVSREDKEVHFENAVRHLGLFSRRSVSIWKLVPVYWFSVNGKSGVAC